jgi:hypothetical protein
MVLNVTFALRCLCIVLFACSISGCGFVKTFYNNAPEVITWWLDDYFDFTTDQNALLKDALIRVHDWHRNHQLPEDIKTLTALKHALSEESISASQACAHIDQIKMRFNVLQVAFIPVISEIAPLIGDEQLTYLKQKLNKRAEKWKSEWWQETPKEQIEARLEKTVDFAEKVYGNLSEAQREMIAQKLLNSPTQPSIVYTEILRRNQDIIQIINALRSNELNQTQKNTLIEAGFDRLQSSPNIAYQLHANQMTQRTCEIVSELHTSTSQLQKQHANAWISAILNQLLKL